MRCSDGHVRWGRFGAAGVLFVHADGGTPRVMLQLRSAFAHEGSTWSCAGGALDEGESAFDGAMREAGEEVGEPTSSATLVGEHVFAPADDWSYTTCVVEVAEQFGSSLNFETDAVDWVPIDQVLERPLHPGFASAWPHLCAIIVDAFTRKPPSTS
jgi:8-oxo-dGTP diphosphatase